MIFPNPRKKNKKKRELVFYLITEIMKKWKKGRKKGKREKGKTLFLVFLFLL